MIDVVLVNKCNYVHNYLYQRSLPLKVYMKALGIVQFRHGRVIVTDVKLLYEGEVVSGEQFD